MPYQYADYINKAGTLAAAAHSFLDALEQGENARESATQRLELAAYTGPAVDRTLGFSPLDRGGGPPVRISADDALSALLFEVQAANVLLGAAVAVSEHEQKAEKEYLKEATAEMQVVSGSVRLALTRQAQLGFAPGETVTSGSLEEAKKSYQDEAEKVLKKVLQDSASVLRGVVEEIKKMDANKVLEGIDQIGKAWPAITTTKRLINAGLEKLKKVLEAMANIFGEDLLQGVKEKVKELWEKITGGDVVQTVLEKILGVEAARMQVDKALGQDKLEINQIDGATTKLIDLMAKFEGSINLMRSLVKAIALAAVVVAVILPVLHIVAPWVPLAVIGLYGSVMAATVLVGMDYCDSGNVLDWVPGIGKISGKIKPAGSFS